MEDVGELLYLRSDEARGWVEGNSVTLAPMGQAVYCFANRFILGYSRVRLCHADCTYFSTATSPLRSVAAFASATHFEMPLQWAENGEEDERRGNKLRRLAQWRFGRLFGFQLAPKHRIFSSEDEFEPQ